MQEHRINTHNIFKKTNSAIESTNESHKNTHLALDQTTKKITEMKENSIDTRTLVKQNSSTNENLLKKQEEQGKVTLGINNYQKQRELFKEAVYKDYPLTAKSLLDNDKVSILTPDIACCGFFEIIFGTSVLDKIYQKIQKNLASTTLSQWVEICEKLINNNEINDDDGKNFKKPTDKCKVPQSNRQP